MPAAVTGHAQEASFTAAGPHADPLGEVDLVVRFAAPSGRGVTRGGFWDGGRTWRGRVWADEPGTWTYRTQCAGDAGLDGQSGSFEVPETVPQQSGGARPEEGADGDVPGGTQSSRAPVRLSENRRYLVTSDGRPFFWLADTAWNGALHSSAADWAEYLAGRKAQEFTAIQFVGTQWRACAHDRDGQVAYTGRERIAVNPAFFARLERRMEAVRAAGLLPAPVMLWALSAGSPGVDLPVDQAVRLARYELARWGGAPVLLILGGDGDYRSDKAARWREIGRGVFRAGEARPVVAMHCGGQTLPVEEFRGEAWCDILGYQSGHGDAPEHLAWLVNGPPSREWEGEPRAPSPAGASSAGGAPAAPLLNLEPNYEGHAAYHSKQPVSTLAVRRAAYWSCLIAPTAGVSYGTNGIWWWSPTDTAEVPLNHPRVGVAPPWREAAQLPGAGQMKFLRQVFERVEWWRLVPAPELLARQPGQDAPERFIAAARTDDRAAAVVYIPADREVELKLGEWKVVGEWINPRTGQTAGATGVLTGWVTLKTPGEGDWVLVLRRRVRDLAGECRIGLVSTTTRT